MKGLHLTRVIKRVKAGQFSKRGSQHTQLAGLMSKYAIRLHIVAPRGEGHGQSNQPARFTGLEKAAGDN